ncbi:MAG: hypothetical protein FWB86_05315 [Treponema sp.]|nr:hypothetical protein [Treponema sp.]
MKLFKFLICFLIVIGFTSCFSTPSKSNDTDVMLYFYKNPSTEYIEYESISLSGKSSLAIYSVDRNNALIEMEIGTYSIVDGVITINAGKFQAVGTITDEKIVIDDKEYLRT